MDALEFIVSPKIDSPSPLPTTLIKFTKKIGEVERIGVNAQWRGEGSGEEGLKGTELGTRERARAAREEGRRYHCSHATIRESRLCRLWRVGGGLRYFFNSSRVCLRDSTRDKLRTLSCVIFTHSRSLRAILRILACGARHGTFRQVFIAL